MKQKKGQKSKSNRKPAVGFKDMTSTLTKSITTPVHNPESAPIASKSQHPTRTPETGALGDHDSESEDADNEGSESESESEIGVEVHSGMESDDVGLEVPPEDNEFNVDEEVDINSPVLRRIIGQDLTLTIATASKTTSSNQLLSTDTSFEMNNEDFNKLWES